MERGGKKSIMCMCSHRHVFVIASDFQMTQSGFVHSECVTINIITGCLCHQVGVCETGVQSWAEEHCKYSDGQGLAGMPKFRWVGSHVYLKHSCVCSVSEGSSFF